MRIHETKRFVELSKSLDRHRSENNFVGLTKWCAQHRR